MVNGSYLGNAEGPKNPIRYTVKALKTDCPVRILLLTISPSLKGELTNPASSRRCCYQARTVSRDVMTADFGLNGFHLW